MWGGGKTYNREPLKKNGSWGFQGVRGRENLPQDGGAGVEPSNMPGDQKKTKIMAGRTDNPPGGGFFEAKRGRLFRPATPEGGGLGLYQKKPML